MSEEIKRYNFYGISAGMCSKNDGDYVKYSDHEAIVQSLREEIANLKRDRIPKDDLLKWVNENIRSVITDNPTLENPDGHEYVITPARIQNFIQSYKDEETK